MGTPLQSSTAQATVVRPRPSRDGSAPVDTSSRGRVAGGLREAALPLAAVFACAFLAAVAGALAIRTVGRAVLGVPDNFEPLLVPNIFPYAFAPVVGCSAAYIIFFIVKRPGPRSAHLFIAVGLKFILLDSLLAVLSLPNHTSLAAILTLLAVIAYPLLIIPALLRFVPRPAVTALPST